MKRISILAAILLAVIFTSWPLPAKADGGPMVDPMLFAKLKEGQQVAVIQFHDTNTASVDLFISILDQTGESHEIVFFVPLGVKADEFAVREQDSLTLTTSSPSSWTWCSFRATAKTSNSCSLCLPGRF